MSGAKREPESGAQGRPWPTNARAFFRAIPLTFQRGPAKGWKAVLHFDLSGPDAVRATVRIDDGTLVVDDALVGDADVLVRAEGRVQLDIATKRRSPRRPVAAHEVCRGFSALITGPFEEPAAAIAKLR